MEGSHEHLAIARTRSSYFVKLNLSIRLDNIDSSNKKIEGKGFNKEISFKSDIRPDKLGSLNDGNFTANNWYTSNANNYLTIILPEKQSLKGFRLDTNTSPSGSYMLKSCRVMVETPDGNWVNHGVFDRKSMDGIAYISFKKPVECTKVRRDCYFISPAPSLKPCDSTLIYKQVKQYPSPCYASERISYSLLSLVKMVCH